MTYSDIHRLTSSDGAYSAKVVVAELCNETLPRTSDVEHVLTHRLQQRYNILGEVGVVCASSSEKAERASFSSEYSPRNRYIVEPSSGRSFANRLAHFNRGRSVNRGTIDETLPVHGTGENSARFIEEYVASVATFVDNCKSNILQSPIA